MLERANYTLSCVPDRAADAGAIIARFHSMTGPSPARWEALPLEKVTEMVTRKTVIGSRLTMSQSYLKKGALVPRHRHDAEQIIYVLQGALRARLGADVMTVREGEVLVVPGGTFHQAEALDDTFVLDVVTVSSKAEP